MPPPDALRPPRTVIEIAQKLRDAGYETWCVGGAVRDALLGINNQDWDLATAAPPAETRRLFRHTIPLGIEFGTVGVVDRDGKMHEVTTFRRDVKHDGRHAIVEFGASLREDLNRRDYTINAIAFDPFEKTLYDPFHGRDDLAAGVVRAVGTPIERFIEDRLRVLRGIRFAARFGFQIEPVTWRAIVDSAPHMGRLSAERVKQELDKTLEQTRRPSEAFRLWQRAGVFKTVIPSLENVDDATLLAIDALPAPVDGSTAARRSFRRQLRLIVLFSALPAAEVTRALKALRAPNAEIALAAAMIERWHLLSDAITRALTNDKAPLHAMDSSVATSRTDGSLGGPAAATLREWASVIGRTRIRIFMRLVWARFGGDEQARRSTSNTMASRSTATAIHELHRRLLHVAAHDPIELADLAVDGDDLRSAGIPDGPHYGTLLRELLQLVLHDPARNKRETLLSFALARYDELRDRDAKGRGST